MMLGLYRMGLGRGGAFAVPTGFIVLIAVGLALLDAGDDLDLQARVRGEEVNHEVSSGMQTATYGAAAAGLAVLLVGGTLVVRALRDDEDGEEELPVHGGGPPAAPGDQGIDIG